MHVHRLRDNENECNKQCYKIGANIFFRWLNISSNLLNFILSNKSFKISFEKLKQKIFSLMDFFRKINFLSNFKCILFKH